MKTGRVFWGVFFLTLGAAFLLDRFGVLQLGWHHALKYWPVVLIAWGAAILFGNKAIKVAAVIVASAVLALALAAVLSFSWEGDAWDDSTISEELFFHEAYQPGVQKAGFRLDAGAGTFTIADTTADFVEARTMTGIGKYLLEREGEGDETEFTLRLTNMRKKFPLGRAKNDAAIRLNRTPVWDVNIDVGAAKMRCDLSAYKVASLDLDCGAARVDLRLGKGVPESRVQIDAGASSIDIEVPAEVGCEVHIEAPLSSKSLPGFTRITKGEFKTENFDTAPEHCIITIDAGVSSISIDRY